METNRLDCTNHTEVLRRLDQVECQVKTLTEKVNIVEKDSIKYDERIQNIFNILDKFEKTLIEISNKLDQVIARPGKKWEGMTDKIMAALIGAVISGLTGAIFYLLTLVK